MVHNMWRGAYGTNLHQEIDMSQVLECINILSFQIIFLMAGSMCKYQLNTLKVCHAYDVETAFGTDKDALEGKPVVDTKPQVHKPELEDYLKKRDYFIEKDLYGDKKASQENERAYPTDKKNK